MGVLVLDIRKSSLILDKSIHMHSFRGCDSIGDFIDSRFSGREVLVYFDPDIDGLVSGFLVCRALFLRGIRYRWYINTGREHGFLLPVSRVRGMGIICVDFLIEPVLVRELVEAGCDLLSFDHHEVGDRGSFIEYTCEGSRGIVINNQYSFEEESSRYLSGAGVVFESLVSYFGESFNTRENRALVGLTLLTDIRNIENINARLYLQDLYTHPYKGYIGYLLEHTLGDRDYSFGVPRLDRNYVDYTFSPIINSCLRFNAQDEVVRFMLGSGVLDRGYHARQKELISRLMEVARVIRYSGLSVVVVDVGLFRDSPYYSCLSGFVGLLASRYLDGGRSVIAYLVDGRNVGRASFRGRVNGIDYLSALLPYVRGVGHGSAFGIRGLEPSAGLFRSISSVCEGLEAGIDCSVRWVSTGNLSLFASSRAYALGVENIYCLAYNRVYIRYVGSNVKNRRSGAKYKEYDIDGVSVLSFDDSLDPCRDLILPVLERGVLCFYLDRKFN